VQPRSAAHGIHIPVCEHRERAQGTHRRAPRHADEDGDDPNHDGRGAPARLRASSGPRVDRRLPSTDLTPLGEELSPRIYLNFFG